MRLRHQRVIWSWQGVRMCEKLISARPAKRGTTGYQSAGETLAHTRRSTPATAQVFETVMRFVIGVY